MSEDQSEAQGASDRSPTRRELSAHSRRWFALALLLFALASLYQFRGIFEAGFGRVVPVDWIFVNEKSPWRDSTRADLVFHTFTVSRAARALLEHPLDFFDAPQCFPFDRSATLGIPMGAMGVLATPFVLAQENPVVTYNAVILVTLFLAGLALFLLVREWTGSPPAAIVVGLLYCIHPFRLREINFTSQLDDIWTVFALFFATRWLTRGGWRYALGVTLAFSMQALASVYPLLEATVMLPPILLWMFWRYGVQKISAAQVAFVALVAAGVLAWFYLPYLESREFGLLTGRAGEQLFAGPLRQIPGAYYFVGWPAIGLAALGAILGSRGRAASLPGDPRFAIAVGMLLVAWVAAGPEAAYDTGLPIPDAYAALSAIVPGLGNIRGIGRLIIGVYLGALLLGGFGIAGLLRLLGARSSRLSAMVAALCIALAGVAALKPQWVGLPIKIVWQSHRVEAAADAIAFFDALAERGNTGPLLEIPFDTGLAVLYRTPQRVLLSHFHGRRTSACAGSFYPADRTRIGELARSLPDPEAVAELMGMGFTTVVLHHGPHPLADRDRIRAKFARQHSSARYRLRPILQTDRRSAWAIEAMDEKPRG
jgi:hypothetical protein